MQSWSTGEELILDLLSHDAGLRRQGMFRAREISRRDNPDGLFALETAMVRLSKRRDFPQFFRTEAVAYVADESWHDLPAERRGWRELTVADIPCVLHSRFGTKARIGNPRQNVAVPEFHGLLVEQARSSRCFNDSLSAVLDLAAKRSLLNDPIETGWYTYAILLFGIGLDAGTERVAPFLQAMADAGGDEEVHAFQLLGTHIQAQSKWKIGKSPLLTTSDA